jgi:hypothetical protein
MPKPKEELTIEHLLSKRGVRIKVKQSLISKNRLFKLIKNGFAYGVKSKTGVKV